MYRLIVDQVHEAAEAFCKDESDDIRVLEVCCWNHLQNMWLGGTKNALYTLLGIIMGGGGEINLRLRVLTSIESVLRTVDKDFILCDNYPKGHREIFR